MRRGRLVGELLIPVAIDPAGVACAPEAALAIGTGASAALAESAAATARITNWWMPCDSRNRTSVLAGCTFTSTPEGGKVMKSA